MSGDRLGMHTRSLPPLVWTLFLSLSLENEWFWEWFWSRKSRLASIISGIDLIKKRANWYQIDKILFAFPSPRLRYHRYRLGSLHTQSVHSRAYETVSQLSCQSEFSSQNWRNSVEKINLKKAKFKSHLFYPFSLQRLLSPSMPWKDQHPSRRGKF